MNGLIFFNFFSHSQEMIRGEIHYAGHASTGEGDQNLLVLISFVSLINNVNCICLVKS